MWPWPGSCMAWRNHTAGKKGWRRKRSQCAQLINPNGFYLFFFFFCYWLTHDCISVQILHKKKKINHRGFLTCIYCSYCHIFAWITIFGGQKWKHTSSEIYVMTYLQPHLWLSVLVWMSSFRHYSIKCRAVSAELSPAPDKDGSVSWELYGGEAGRLLSFLSIMGILQVHNLSEQRW